MRTDSNTDWFDQYSVVHAAWGAVFAASRISAPLAIGSHLAFEAVENRLKRVAWSAWPDTRPDGIQNHVGDMLSFITGYFVTEALKSTTSGRALAVGFVAAGAAIWMVNHAVPRDVT